MGSNLPGAFHQYINNFTRNQDASYWLVPTSKALPESLDVRNDILLFPGTARYGSVMVLLARRRTYFGFEYTHCKVPVRPIPHITSSMISNAPYLSQTARAALKYPRTAGTQPRACELFSHCYHGLRSLDLPRPQRVQLQTRKHSLGRASETLYQVRLQVLPRKTRPSPCAPGPCMKSSARLWRCCSTASARTWLVD